jgi:hypothetical protein
MTVHHVGPRPPAGFQNANYLAQGGDATSGLACSYLHGSVAISRPREIVSLCASSFRAAAQNSSDFHVLALSLRMSQRQLVLSQFRHRLRRRRTPEPH